MFIICCEISMNNNRGISEPRRTYIYIYFFHLIQINIEMQEKERFLSKI